MFLFYESHTKRFIINEPDGFAVAGLRSPDAWRRSADATRQSQNEKNIKWK